jgi:Tfp pilus assembly protein PilX
MGQKHRITFLSKLRQEFWRFFAVPNVNFPSSNKSTSSLNLSSKGSVLVMAAIFMVVAAILVVTGFQLMTTVNKQARQQELYTNEAKNAALAGLQDATGWFIRQNTQPVAAAVGFGAEPTVIPTYAPSTLATPGPNFYYVDQAFNPQYDSADPMLGDTLNATIGIENEFSPQGAGSVSEGASNDTMWDRYEVYKQTNALPTPGVPTYTPNPYAAHDISGERVNGTFNGSGMDWYLVSYGYVYKRNDFRKVNAGVTGTTGTDWAVPYNKSPNQLLATAKMATEIRKLSVQNPFGVGAPIYAEYLNQVSIASGSGDQVTGFKNPPYYGAAGVTTTSAVTTVSGHGHPVTTITSTTTCPYPAGWDSTNFPDPPFCAPASQANELTDEYVFGMSVTNIGTIADYLGNSGPATQILNINKTINQLAYYSGNLTFDPSSSVTQYRNLDASGILVVNGSLTITSNSTNIQSYSGIIFVTGNFTLNGGNIDGEIIMGYTGPPTASAGNVSINSASDGTPAIVTYDPNLLKNTILPQVAKYREVTSEKRLLLAVPSM